jgi:NADH-quinone oxidoreductase subunit A
VAPRSEFAAEPQRNSRVQLLAANDFWIVGLLVLAAIAAASLVLLLTHLIGPSRHGERKESTYESGMDPVGDTRKRFNVRFYLVAVLFLVFDVEIVFLYPWASMFGDFAHYYHAAPLAGVVQRPWADLAGAGYSPLYLFGGMSIFFALLVVGFVYEWRRGLFKWD